MPSPAPRRFNWPAPEPGEPNEPSKAWGRRAAKAGTVAIPKAAKETRQPKIKLRHTACDDRRSVSLPATESGCTRVTAGALPRRARFSEPHTDPTDPRLPEPASTPTEDT